ncbi:MULTISPECIES: S-layer homology domain-containing protein [unclassified Coleofasciculus]|uniref:S-layer homology domain-containing protein n=1 Tax=unclassified Coleofasciculus TaxID=2692782 RepID=UPI001881DDC2|nr:MULTISPECIES: S-layer homology domain-containing protein [unclassified Coleofasciculus]MBE9128444.1 S-layer homology domain-containing protein [Coleofasciculus sp. LEGE 07081]MBE9149399.1 S-layer homology domain-containing protein [Coleofasciculus sp. LEGE 07092]
MVQSTLRQGSVTTLYVNPVTGSDANAGSVNTPFKTLTWAIEQVAADTTIYLAPSTYNTANGEQFPLVIPAGTIVVGHEPSKGKEIAIVGSGQYNSPTFGNQAIALRLESGAELRGVTVTNPAENGTGVWIESAAPVVANSTFTRCRREGIFVTGTSKPLILDNELKENAASGIFLVRNAKGEVLRNLCQTTGYGIAISDSAAPLVADNTLVNNRAGIVLSRDARPVLRRNRIENNTEAGLMVNGNAQPNLGSTQDPAGNILQNNGKVDLQNGTSLTLVSVGNLLNPARISGSIDLRSAQVLVPALGPVQFRDLTGHWAGAFIRGLVDKGLISGFPDGTFKPEESITRAQYAAIIAKAFDLPRQVGASTGSFRDIPSDFWASAAIQKAGTMGFISGFPDNTFRPQQNLTRTQALVSLINGLGLTGGNSNILQFYRDRAQIPSYATDPISTATGRRMVVNYPQTDVIEPMRAISRAEVAVLIYQALVSAGKAEAIASPYIVNPDSYVPSFTDIQNHWAEDFIRRLAGLNLVSGFADGSFKPDVPLNRAQYAALVVKVFNPTPIRPATQFSDVPTNFWAASVIQAAYRGGFLSGFPDQTFHPQQSLRRVELIVSLVNGLSLPKAAANALETYQDRDTIPAYAQSAVAASTQAGIIVNYPQQSLLQPKQAATRADASAFLYQALVNKGRANAINSPYIVRSS